MNETRGLSGIYFILNKVNLDYYIGYADTGRFHARFYNHLFNYHDSKVIKNAVKKHGVSSFAFIVLELFPEIVNKENKKIFFIRSGRLLLIIFSYLIITYLLKRVQALVINIAKLLD